MYVSEIEIFLKLAVSNGVQSLWKSHSFVLSVCAFMILPYGVTILLVPLAGLPRVTVSVWNTFVDILSTIFLDCLSWDSQASTLWYTLHTYNVSFANRLSACDNVLVYLRQRRRYMFSPARLRSFICLSVCKITQQEVKVIWQKAPYGGPIPRLGVTPGGRKLYRWIPGVGFPISVP